MQTKISELRKKIGMTQEELAEKCEVTRQTIISLEAGRYNPSLLLAWKISRALGQKHVEDVFIMR
jgi:putative transcriptional regulator